MKIRIQNILICAVLIYSSCQSGSHVDYSSVGKHLCSCSDELYRSNRNFEDLVKLKKQDKAISLIDSIEVEEEKFQSCILDDNKKQKMFEDKKFTELLSKSLKTTCPEKEILIMKVVEDTKLKLNE